VLSHVLGSHNQICGYSELNHSYSCYQDLNKIKFSLHHDLQIDLQGKYLLDKILHNDLEVSKEVLDVAKPKIIFLLRGAESTIKSIINMGNITGIEWYKSPEQAANYYCSRLSGLTEYVNNISNEYFFLESDDLVNKTDDVLRSLSIWLELDTPLFNRYKQFTNTGKPGFGDPSENIRTGRLICTKDHTDIHIPEEVLHMAELAYEQCKTSLTRVKNRGN